MLENKRNQVIGITLLIVILGAVYSFTKDNIPSPSTSDNLNATSSSATITTSADIAGGTLGITATGGYTVKEVTEKNDAPKAPDYNALLTFSTSVNLNAEQKAILQTQAAGLRTQLAKNPSNYTSWLALGRTFKMAGDYAEAAKIWTYVSLNWPTDPVAPANLGDLYMNFIKDYPKADASYLGAIRNNPRQTNAYRNLFQLYSSMYTTHASAAEDILKKGIQNNPEALDLYVLLARHYRDLGRTAEARAEYDMAIVIAKGQTNVGAASILADIIAERAALK